MKKRKSRAFGKDIYFLGCDSDGTRYWLEAACWDCEWYWGGGYVETYTNNSSPEKSRDIKSHQHFDGLFFKGNKCGYDEFKTFFAAHPFTDSEVWKICELMRAFYIARHYSDMLHCGGAHYTTNPARDVIKSTEEYDRINKSVIPAIMEELYKILEGGEQ
jgi:hypothetical protein